jgi:hypothetical protein
MMMLALVKNGILTGCFTPCADGRSLLKTLAVAERRAVAGRFFLNDPHSQRLQTQTGGHDDFNTPWSFERENFVAENSTTQPQHERTQPAPNQ